jgi:rod shape-determining protein MreC
MRPPDKSRPRVAAQVRSLIDRSALALLVLLSVMLLLLSKADVKLVNFLALRLGDGAAPVLGMLVEPLASVRRGVDGVGELLAVYEENARLRDQNRRLLAWQAEAGRLAVQNRALREMLKVPPVERVGVSTTARVVADTGGLFVRTLLVDAGEKQGIAPGMPAVTPEGLAGRVVDVGCCSARVLLVTDFNSKIPVVLERSGDPALLVGDNSPQPALRFLPLDPDFAVGDRVITSGTGGLIPPGLVVGRISAVSTTKVAVESFVDWARLDYLALLHYAGVPLPSEPGARP